MSSQKKIFLLDELIQDGVIRNFEIIGEAASKIGRELREKYSQVPWSDAIGMRNCLIHGYFSVDNQILWDTANRILPAFLVQIERIQKEIQEKEDGIAVDHSVRAPGE